MVDMGAHSSNTAKDILATGLKLTPLQLLKIFVLVKELGMHWTMTVRGPSSLFSS